MLRLPGYLVRICGWFLVFVSGASCSQMVTVIILLDDGLRRYRSHSLQHTFL